jgi:hypothetical protein
VRVACSRASLAGSLANTAGLFAFRAKLAVRRSNGFCGGFAYSYLNGFSRRLRAVRGFAREYCVCGGFALAGSRGRGWRGSVFIFSSLARRAGWRGLRMSAGCARLTL